MIALDPQTGKPDRCVTRTLANRRSRRLFPLRQLRHRAEGLTAAVGLLPAQDLHRTPKRLSNEGGSRTHYLGRSTNLMTDPNVHPSSEGRMPSVAPETVDAFVRLLGQNQRR